MGEQAWKEVQGEDAVFHAILCGERETRSTIHFATEDYAEGPIAVQSKAFEVPDKVRKWISNNNYRPVRRYADKLQDEMKLYGDGPAYLKAIGSIASGELGLEGKCVYQMGIELPCCGIRLT
jgi:folate-dependent phosphoribosylglycinamide formyltransferase PurN